ncbi:MAG: hypothetical protein N3B10_01840 [Armatimonadetes bacterium]|nr:hypothetical protein [Armatimonadota bacterium]MCX7967210.1 hypothetical protein [Armatimonadota bacterium]MDW8143602.1 hypothetical protein [Armatimonadota bacterium]
MSFLIPSVSEWSQKTVLPFRLTAKTSTLPQVSVARNPQPATLADSYR